MRVSAIATVLALSAVQIFASPLSRREVPQEHSHDIIVNQVRKILNQNANTLPDPIFALLGNAAASNGIAQAGSKLTDPNCLQQNIADQSITNCKAGKTAGFSAAQCIATAVKFRALERNSGSVGAVSASCTTAPTNKELSTIKQHQDPASTGAATNNGDVEIAVAKVLLSLGLTADEAANGSLETSTFGPGKLGDPTARGLSCDDGAGGNFGGAVIAAADGTDPITGFTFKKGDTIDCITKADVDNSTSKRVPAKSKAQLLAAIGGNAAAATTTDAAAATTTTADAAATTTSTTATGNIDFAAVAKLLEEAIALLKAAA
ncbi:hypothetical protein HK096_002295 [Nowakowskiella sp. JEL0078]|nr:hypothetical protein HK096_002295 [Nowakowskiella sp. JEL0078]